MYLYIRYKYIKKTCKMSENEFRHTHAAETFDLTLRDAGLSSRRRRRAVTVNNISPEFHCVEQIYTLSLHAEMYEELEKHR